jgi:hypothetical protein
VPHGIEIELIDRIKAMVRDLVTERAATLADLRYAGVRLEVSAGRYATAENGAPKASGDDCALAFGIRVLAGSRMIYPISNCGKGQPMQTKKLGNRGPTMRSRAILTGGR